ncbi:MAG: ComEA family DNA-binding protein [Giesbergeria sp.]
MRTCLGMLLTAALLWSSSALAQVDINTASEAQLDSIRGVGPATTRRILQERERQPFKDWADLVARVRGIGSASAARFSAQGFTVNGQPYGAPHAAASTSAQ